MKNTMGWGLLGKYPYKQGITVGVGKNYPTEKYISLKWFKHRVKSGSILYIIHSSPYGGEATCWPRPQMSLAAAEFQQPPPPGWESPVVWWVEERERTQCSQCMQSIPWTSCLCVEWETGPQVEWEAEGLDARHGGPRQQCRCSALQVFRLHYYIQHSHNQLRANTRLALDHVLL